MVQESCDSSGLWHSRPEKKVAGVKTLKWGFLRGSCDLDSSSTKGEGATET